MAVIAWIVLGLVAGFIASKIMNKTADGVILNIILGIVGALVGGFLFENFGVTVSWTNLYGILAALAGTVVVIVTFHAFLRRSVQHRPRGGWR